MVFFAQVTVLQDFQGDVVKSKGTCRLWSSCGHCLVWNEGILPSFLQNNLLSKSPTHSSCVFIFGFLFFACLNFFWHCYSEAELPLGLISCLMTLISDILKGKISLNVLILQMILKGMLLKKGKKSISEVGLYGILLHVKHGLCYSSFWFQTCFAWTCLKADWKIGSHKSAVGVSQSGARRRTWLWDVVFGWIWIGSFEVGYQNSKLNRVMRSQDRNVFLWYILSSEILSLLA